MLESILTKSFQHGLKLIVICMVLLAVGREFSLAAPPQQSGDDPLFEESEVQKRTANDPSIIRSRQVNVNFGQLGGDDGTQRRARSTGNDDELQLNLFDDVTLTAKLDRLVQKEPGTFIWVGEVVGDPYSQVILSVKDGIMAGSIHQLGGGKYQVSYLGDGVHAIEEVGNFPFIEEEPVVVTPPPGVPQNRLSSRQADDGSVIDVMIVYTPAVGQAEGGQAAMQTIGNMAIEWANQSFQRSGVNPRLRLVHTAQVNYTEIIDNLGPNLDRLKATNDGFMDNVHTLRDTHRADLVALIVQDGPDTGCGGLAGVTAGTNSTFYATNAFGVTELPCVKGGLVDVFVHEIGHNMGGQHDWHVSNATQPFPYSHGYVQVIPNDTNRTWRTIMAYANRCTDSGVDYFDCQTIPYWSNPDLTFQGDALGIPEGQAQAADNRKTFNNLAQTVANFRSGAEAPAGGPLVFDSRVIDDNGQDQSNGNNDGIANCGEDIELLVRLRNQGANVTTGVNATLSTTNQNATILQNTSSAYPDINGNGTAQNTNDFEVRISPNTPNGQNIQFSLNIQAGNGGPWNATFNVPVTCAVAGDNFEPNNTSGQATTVTAGTPQTHSIAPADDIDWLTFTLAGESAVQLETSGAAGDTRMWLYDANLNQIQFDDDGGTQFFSKIVRTCNNNALAAGTYFVKIDEYQNDSAIPNYNVALTVTETCANFPQLVYSNRTINDAGTGNGNGTADCGERLALSVELQNQGGTAATGINAVVSTTNNKVTWLDNTTSGYNNLAPTATGNSLNPFELQLANDIPNGQQITFNVTMNATNGGPWQGTFTVPVTCQQQTTGDTYEPDNESNQAKNIIPNVTQSHSINPAGDIDWVTFVLPQESAIQIQTGGNEGDTVMFLFNQAGQTVEVNDDAPGLGFFSLIDRLCGQDALPAGRYYVAVREFNNARTLPAYNIRLLTNVCANAFLAYEAHRIDDDNEDESKGNGDGLVNCGEDIEMFVDLVNTSTDAITGTKTTISSSDPNVEWLFNVDSSYPDIPANGVATNLDDYAFSVDSSTPNGHELEFELTIKSEEDGVPWTDTFAVPVACSEVAPLEPDTPTPANDATAVGVLADLNWNTDNTETDNIVYDVYLEAGDETPDTLVCSDVSGTTCDPGTLTPNTLYYWQLVAKGENELTTDSTVWQFTTGGANTIPNLTIPNDIPAYEGLSVSVPVNFSANGNDIASAVFSVDFDQSCLSFDPTDEDSNDIPDAITLNVPNGFSPVVSFDETDEDGEIDVSLFDLVPPFSALESGALATIDFTVTCQTTDLTPLAFSETPPVSFGDTNGQDVPGFIKGGSVAILTGIRGDCNSDQAAGAGDVPAVVLEIFDGDGTSPAQVPGGAFLGNAIGCNANADEAVNVGDVICTSLIVSEGEQACIPETTDNSTAAGSSSGDEQLFPTLTIPDSVVDSDEETVSIPVNFEANGAGIVGVSFSIDYDETTLTLDDTDSNGDSIPDAVTLDLPADFELIDVSLDANDTDGELDVTIADISPPFTSLPSGAIATMTFNTGGLKNDQASLRFSNDPSASFSNSQGQDVSGATENGTVTTGTGDGGSIEIFLPVILK